jgi:hypothetical protein
MAACGASTGTAPRWNEAAGIDDTSAFLGRFRDGSLTATFEAVRCARGHRALYTLEINGERASALWDLHDLRRVQCFDHADEGPLRGWRNIHVTKGDHPCRKLWRAPGLRIGCEHKLIRLFAYFLERCEPIAG